MEFVSFIASNEGRRTLGLLSGFTPREKQILGRGLRRLASGEEDQAEVFAAIEMQMHAARVNRTAEGVKQ